MNARTHAYREKTVLTALNLIFNGVVAKKLESVRVSLKTMTVIAHAASCSSGALKGGTSSNVSLKYPLFILYDIFFTVVYIWP